jgi:hypothetical protein
VPRLSSRRVTFEIKHGVWGLVRDSAPALTWRLRRALTLKSQTRDRKVVFEEGIIPVEVVGAEWSGKRIPRVGWRNRSLIRSFF